MHLLYISTLAPNYPPPLSLFAFSILTPSKRVWTTTAKQTTAHAVGKRKGLQKKEKKSPWQRKEEQLQAELATALRREELALFISEMTSTENILICLRDNMITFA